MTATTTAKKEEKRHRRDATVWLMIVAIVLIFGTAIRNEQVNDNVDRGKVAAQDAEDAATRAAIASEKASADLTAAIEASSSPEARAQATEAYANLNVSRLILCEQFPESCERAKATIATTTTTTTEADP